MAAKRDVGSSASRSRGGIDREIVRFVGLRRESAGSSAPTSNVGKLWQEAPAAIFDAHRSCSRTAPIDDIERRISATRQRQWAVTESTVALAKRFAKIDDEYLRRAARTSDVSPAPAYVQGIAHHEISRSTRRDPGRRRPRALGRSASGANVVGFVVSGRTPPRSSPARSAFPVSGVVSVTGMVSARTDRGGRRAQGVVVLHPTELVLDSTGASARPPFAGRQPSSSVATGRR
jgi:hypothetical protein